MYYQTVDFSKSFFKMYLFSYCYCFLAVVGLCCCERAFCSCSELGLFLPAACGLLIAAAPLVAEHRLQALRLQ